MAILSPLTWIGNAAAVLLGHHGAVAAQARDAGCSRQAAYDHATKVQQAVARAGRVLEALDAASRPQVTQLCLDEIFFHGTPVLVAVEPASLAVLHCRREADRTGATWARTLRPFTGLEAVCRDAGSG